MSTATTGTAGLSIGRVRYSIVAMLFAVTMVNYADRATLAIAGLSGGLFNMFGNISSITTPIVIGTIIQGTGSFNGALVFIGANAAVAILSYLAVVGEIKRLELRPPPTA